MKPATPRPATVRAHAYTKGAAPTNSRLLAARTQSRKPSPQALLPLNSHR
jgi:hypothetical protein